MTQPPETPYTPPTPGAGAHRPADYAEQVPPAQQPWSPSEQTWAAPAAVPPYQPPTTPVWNSAPSQPYQPAQPYAPSPYATQQPYQAPTPYPSQQPAYAPNPYQGPHDQLPVHPGGGMPTYQPGQPPAGYPQPGWSPTAPGQSAVSWDYLGAVQQPWAPPRKRRTPALLAAAVAVVLVGGGTATYVAVSQQSGGGGSSPQAAVRTFVGDLNKSDLLGVLDDLAPGERDALLNPFEDGITQEKRLHVLKPDADASKVSAISVSATGLTFASQDEVLNDHVRIVKLTGGTITVNADFSKLPFTDEFMKQLFPHGLPPASAPATVDIGQLVNTSGVPIEIATQKVGASWYPSILYTVAAYDVSSGGATPSASDYIGAVGASSPQDAVNQFIGALVAGDGQRAVQLTSPDEMAVLHDFGSQVAAALSSSAGSSGFGSSVKVSNLQLTTTAITGGQRVLFHSATITDDGKSATITLSGDCVQIDASGSTKKYCGNDLINEIESSSAFAQKLTPEQATAIEHLAQGLPNIGVDTTESGGQWYVNPLRSIMDTGNELYSGLQNDDLIVLLKLANSER